MTSTPTQPPAKTAATTARSRGIRLLKGFGIVYAVLIILYLVHCASGARPLKLEALQGGERLWQSFSFTTPRGARLELAAGDALPPGWVPLLREGTPGPTVGDEVLIHKTGLFYNLPWPGLFGVWNFLGLLLVLYTAGGDALPAAIARYQERLQEELEAARAARQEAEALQARREAIDAELAAEAERLKKKAEEDSRAERERLLEQTRETLARLRESQEHTLKAELERAKADLRTEVTRAAIVAARRGLAAELDAKTHEALVADFVIELKRSELA